jgi:hypothetical protein
MGIVAQCPNGHRVKVKDDLVGKKGTCPTCGAKFRIGPAADGGERSDSIPGLPLAREVPLDPAVIATLPRALPFGAVRAAAAAAAAEAAAQAAAEPAAFPAAHDFPAVADEAQVVEVEDTPAPLLPRRRSIAAIADRPDLTWCIAYPGGDPSEPIDGPTMQDWLEGGQADGTEVVWRADWPQWHPIREVFPEFFPG